MGENIPKFMQNTTKNLPDSKSSTCAQLGSMVRASTLRMKGHGFDSGKRMYLSFRLYLSPNQGA